MSATKNIVGMINRSRRITYLSNCALASNRVYSPTLFEYVAVNRRSRLSPAPSFHDPLFARSLAPLRHVRIYEATLLEAKRGEVAVLDPGLLENRVRVVVDPRGRRVL